MKNYQVTDQLTKIKLVVINAKFYQLSHLSKHAIFICNECSVKHIYYK